MTSNYGGKEREFLDALESDTGRTLAQWMDAIRAQGLSERNDIIDWLRRQGFRFSRASWLERVHHNGGKPIYADRPLPDRGARPQPSRPTAPVRAVLAAADKPEAPPALAAPAPAKPERAPARPAAEAYAAAAANVVPMTLSDPLSPQITSLTARGKAYRPLADFLLREIAKAVPGTTFGVSGQQIVFVRDRAFGTLGISPRDLKLGVAGTTVVLTDARQVDTALLDRIRAAANAS